MPARIEDYALIGDCQTAALVARDGSIDWLCLPRFDSGACFAALLGTPDHGRWRIAPAAPVRRTRRRYRGDTLVLETEHDVDGGTIRVIDCMPPRTAAPDLVRIVEGVRGRVPVRSELAIRFDYGSVVPWVRRTEWGIRAIAGPDTLLLRTSVPLRGEGYTTVGDFTVAAGERVAFDLAWYPTFDREPEETDAMQAVEDTERWWRDWASRCRYDGPWRTAVVRSLVTLKALTYAPTGGIVAAPTTSLPERLGGVRNWDYRYCWIRDATFTLYALMIGGFTDEAHAWREWLLRAVAGMPSQIQIMYGLAGERRLTELELGVAARVRGRGAGPDRQRRAPAAPARHLRRGDGRPPRRAARGPPDRGEHVARPARPAATIWRRSGRSPTRGSGRCGARAATSPTPR